MVYSDLKQKLGSNWIKYFIEISARKYFWKYFRDSFLAKITSKMCCIASFYVMHSKMFQIYIWYKNNCFYLLSIVNLLNHMQKILLITFTIINVF